MITYGRTPVHYPCHRVGPIASGRASKSDDKVDSADRPVTELLIVEGDSAARSVDAVRDRQSQAVLAIQGKPVNALRATAAIVGENPILRRLTEALLGYHLPTIIDQTTFRDAIALVDPGGCYDRVALLMDPDADGIHCGVLVTFFLARFFPKLVDEHRLFVIRAPMFVLPLPDGVRMKALSPPSRPDALLATSPDHAKELEVALSAAGVSPIVKQRFRGLGSLPPTLLREACVDPSTRLESQVTRADVQRASRLFGPG